MGDTASSATQPGGLSWTRGVASANGIDLAWEQAGPEQGEPLLLIMGLGRQLISWPGSMCEALVAQGMRLIRFDNRDIGLSGSGDRGVRFSLLKDSLRKKVGLPVEANYTLHDMTEDTVQLLSALGLERTHVVGVSMGGMIAQLLAAKHAKRVLSLTSIMSSTNHPWLPSPTLEVMRALSGRFEKDCPREVVMAQAMRIGRLIGSPGDPKNEAVLRAEAERAYDRSFRPDGASRQQHAISRLEASSASRRRSAHPSRSSTASADLLVRPKGGQRTAN